MEDRQSPIFTVKNIATNDKNLYHEKLLKWFRKNRRTFPWRKTRDPYKILIAEILLQKTNSRVVSEVYYSFINKYSSPDLVVNSSISEIKKIISPLGLLYKAKRIKKICVSIIEDYGSKVPEDFNDLISLNGVGRYIASAVMLFGFNKPLALLDHNIIRILDRVFSIKSTKSRPHTDKELWHAASELVHMNYAREYNLALLDLSNSHCSPQPICKSCPLKSICKYYSLLKTTSVIY